MIDKPSLTHSAGQAMVHTEGVEDHYLLFVMLTAFANRMQAVGDAVFEEVTWKQWFALLGTSVFEGTPSVSQVAGLVGTSHQNMKQLLLRLQSAGFVRLEKDQADQRRTLVFLQAKAADFELKYREQNRQFMEQLFLGISQKDLGTARQVMERLDYNLRSLAEPKSNQEDMP